MFRVLSFLFALAFVPSAHAATIFENFSNGLNGWSVNGADFRLADSGGRGGANDAFMIAHDNHSNAMTAHFGDGWSGDLRKFDQGTMSFDFIHTSIVQPTLLTSFGRFNVARGNAEARLDVYSGSPSNVWTNISFDFDAAAFGVSQADWLYILEDVTSVKLTLESWSGFTENVGLDNARLSVVPLPAAALFLITSLGGLAFVRRGRA